MHCKYLVKINFDNQSGVMFIVYRIISRTQQEHATIICESVYAKINYVQKPLKYHAPKPDKYQTAMSCLSHYAPAQCIAFHQRSGDAKLFSDSLSGIDNDIKRCKNGVH